MWTCSFLKKLVDLQVPVSTRASSSRGTPPAALLSRATVLLARERATMFLETSSAWLEG